MSERDSYPAGVPCWVETLQRDRRAAHAFYSSLFGWQIVGPTRSEDEYAVARLRGRDVAGIGALPDSGGGLARRGSPTYAWTAPTRPPSARRQPAAAVLDGPFDASPAGRFAVLADPTGALFCAWQADIREGAELVNEPSAWAMSALQTTDPARAAEFYRAVFGWEAERYGPVQLLRLPGYVGGTPDQPVPRDLVAVMAPLDDPGGRSRWDVDFWVQDAEATAGMRSSSAVASWCRRTTGRRSGAPFWPIPGAPSSRSASSSPAVRKARQRRRTWLTFLAPADVSTVDIPTDLGIVGVGAIAEAIVTGLCEGEDPRPPSTCPREAPCGRAGSPLATPPCRSPTAIRLWSSGQTSCCCACDRRTRLSRSRTSPSARGRRSSASSPASHSPRSAPGWRRREVLVRAIPLPAVARRNGLTAIHPEHEVARAIFDPLGGVFAVDDERALDALSRRPPRWPPT